MARDPHHTSQSFFSDQTYMEPEYTPELRYPAILAYKNGFRRINHMFIYLRRSYRNASTSNHFPARIQTALALAYPYTLQVLHPSISPQQLGDYDKLVTLDQYGRWKATHIY